MAYRSAKQRAYMNAQKGKAVPAEVVDEFNSKSKGMKLPKTTKGAKKGK